MIKVIVIDDERHPREVLIRMLNQYFSEEIQVFDETDNVDDAVKLIEQIKPNLIFLDIDIGGTSGFDVLDRIGQHKCAVIFVTAHDKYALKAFEYLAFGYLTKPIKISSFKDTVERALTYLSQPQESSKSYNSALKKIVTKMNAIERLIVPDTNGFEAIRIEEIIRLEGENVYTTIYLNSGRSLVSSKPLKHYAAQLEGTNFLQVHQSHVVNMNLVEKYLKGKNGHLKLFENTIIPVSRSKKALVLDWFNI